ncbi:MAG TPA: PorV/PorQ family protein [Ignavibacteria bacterium]|nr:PorV/PorQ family protein [Ignavibacteria bacterium]
MKKNVTVIVLTCILLASFSLITFGQEKKLAQTGMKFLSLSLGARVSGFGQAATSLEDGAASMFYNPAGMARLTNLTSVSLGRVSYIADINYSYAAIAFAPFDGDYGVIGVNFVNVNYGSFQGTVRANNFQGFVDVGSFSPKAMAIGIGYSKALSEKFAVGGNIKYVYQSLGISTIGIDGKGNYITQSNSTDVLSFDFGLIYKTGFKSLDFGMDVKNFSREVTYIKDSFQLPLIFKMGLSMNIFDLTNINENMHSLLLTIDASHPRDYPEQLSFGGEYTFMKLISLRVGYVTPTDVEGISAGVGIKHSFSGFNFSLDYAFTSYKEFKNVQRITIGFAL